MSRDTESAAPSAQPAPSDPSVSGDPSRGPAAPDPGPPPQSLKRALAAWLLVPLLVVVPAGIVLQYALTLRPALQALDDALGDAALAVASLIRTDAQGLRVEISAQAERVLRSDRSDAIYFAVLDGAGARIAGDPKLAALTVPGDRLWQYADGELDAEPVRVVAHRVDCGQGLPCQVRIAETTHKRHELHRDALAGAALSMTLVAAILVVLMFFAIDRGLDPLKRIGAQIARRSFDNLSPVDGADAPSEVVPLIEALNRLFDRLRRSADAQAAFLADAAHQLRTPLTALRTEAELVMLEPHPPELAPSLKRLNASAARASRLASQLLAWARADSAAKYRVAGEPMDLRQLAADSAQEWVPRAMEAGVDLGYALEPAPLHGRAFLLRELLSNLIHNALSYAGSGARVTVRTRRVGGEAWLEVEDNGPGIAPADRERVFERFDRGAEPRGTGSGLGLAIVRDIAQAHDARVELLDPPGGTGLLVRVRLPAR